MTVFVSTLGKKLLSPNGDVLDAVVYFRIDPTSGKILYLEGKRGWYVMTHIFLQKKSLCIHEKGHVSPVVEMMARQDTILRGKKVITESGKRLGIVVDFSFDEATMRLMQIVSCHRFIMEWNHRTMSERQIVTIGEKYIMVKDDVLRDKVKMEKRVPGISPA